MTRHHHEQPVQLVTNSVDTDHVEETTIDGDRYLIARDVTFIQPQELAGGYVPAEHVAKSAPAWDGEELTVNHPRDNQGRVVSASTDIGQAITVGHARNPSRNADGSVSADLAVNADRAMEIGGEAEDIVDALETGDPLEVSSQYYAEDLPAGVYDGQYRSNVEGNLQPDSIALLPNKQGVCSLPDCGFNPDGAAATANASERLRVPVVADDGPDGPEDDDPDDLMHSDLTPNVSVGGISFAGTADGTLDEADIPNDDYASHYVFDADTKSASSFPLVDAEDRLRRGNVAAAFRFRDDAPDRGELLDVLDAVNDRFEDPPIDPESLAEAMSANAMGLVGNVLSFLGIGDSDTADAGGKTATANRDGNEPAESGADDDPTTESGSTMTDRDELIDEITSNSEIERASLEGMGDQCLQTTHDHIVGNDAADDDGTDPTSDGGDTNTDSPSDSTGGSAGLDAVMSRLDSLEDQMVTEDELEDVAANAREQSQKDELAERIVANSAEYEEPSGVLDDYPTEEALRTKQQALESSGGLPGSGATANMSVGGDSDPDTEDVPSGVLGE